MEVINHLLTIFHAYRLRLSFDTQSEQVVANIKVDDTPWWLFPCGSLVFQTALILLHFNFSIRFRILLCSEWKHRKLYTSSLVHQLINNIHQFSSALLCLTLCGPMNCRTLGLSVYHQLPESTQTHVHWVGDAVQPSHPLSSPFPPRLMLMLQSFLTSGSFQISQLFASGSQNIGVSASTSSFQWTLRTDFL